MKPLDFGPTWIGIAIYCGYVGAYIRHINTLKSVEPDHDEAAPGSNSVTTESPEET